MTKDIRPKTLTVELEGVTYQLQCTMWTIAEAQELCGGDLTPVLRASLKAVLIYLAAMVNDAAQEMGIDKHYTPREIGKALGWRKLGKLSKPVLDLVTDALYDDEAEPVKNPQAPAKKPGE